MKGKIYHKESKIHGSGVFAIKDIKKGEIICIIKGEKKYKINKNKKDALSNPDWVGFKKNFWIDPYLPYKFLNHSCSPNSAIKGNVTLIAIKKIKKNEEITIDYSIIEADPRWEMKCSCNKSNCRGIIRSIQFLSKKAYTKYIPNISKAFQKIYERSN